MRKNYKDLNLHILLVDDEEDIRQIYAQRLKRIGFKVTTAHRADEAMKILVEEQVDFIISDVKMPGASGFDLMSLSKIYEADIPFVLISGHVDMESMDSSNNQAVCCIAKPFDFKDLLRAIEKGLALEEQDLAQTA